MTEREKIERLKQMLLRMCEVVECADCPLLGEECELAEYLTDERGRGCQVNVHGGDHGERRGC